VSVHSGVCVTVGARRRGVLLVRYLMLNEGVKEFVVDRFVPGLACEHCVEVRAAPCAVSLALETGPVRKLLTVCLCGCCPGRLVSFVFDGGAAEAGVDAAGVVEVFDPGGDTGVDLVAGGEGTLVVVLGCEGGPIGLGHGVVPAHSGPPHRHGSLDGAHVVGQLLGGELCSPISMGHDPSGEGAAGGGGHIECGDDQSACCAARPWRISGLDASAHRARRTGRTSLARTAGRWNP